MPAEALKCKECGETYELNASFYCMQCFGPLEVTYDHSALDDAAELRRKIQAGPASIWRYADFLPFAERPKVALEAGFTPLIRSERLAERLGHRRGLRQERRRQPDPLVQGPGRQRRGRQGQGARLRRDRMRLDRQSGERGCRPRRGRRPRLLCVRARRPRGAEDPRDRYLRHQPGGRQRQLRRRQPALHRACRRAPLGVRERQPASLLRRGLEDARLRGLRAARLRAARPRRRSDRLGRAVHAHRSWIRGVDRARPGRGRAADLQRRSGRRLQSGCDRIRERQRDLQAGQAGHDRQVACDRRPGRRTVRARRGASHRRHGRLGHRTRRSSRASSCWRRRPASSPRPPAASRRRS